MRGRPVLCSLSGRQQAAFRRGPRRRCAVRRMADHGAAEAEEKRVPLLLGGGEEGWEAQGSVVAKAWGESKKLWRIAGPAIFTRTTSYSMTIVTQAFAGHLGDLELASMSIATTLAGFSFGLMLGMASALDTLCGQAFGAKKHHMLGIYLQRSWIVLFSCAVLLVPLFAAAAPLLELAGEPPAVAHLAGRVCIWLLPQHFAFAFLFPLNRFLQSQLKNWVTALASGVALTVHVALSCLVVYWLEWGLLGTALALGFSWWLQVLGQLVFVIGGGCPLTWHGFSLEAFIDLWEFVKLSASSGLMLCLENWYYRILTLLTGNLKDAVIAVDALSICLNINNWELMIPFAFLGSTGVRVANELGAGNSRGAKLATVVAAVTSCMIGLCFCCMIVVLHDKFAFLFTSSALVLQAVDKLSLLLAVTILLNSIQPVLSGVAVGSGWQATVAYVNVGTYYLIGIPAGVLLGWPLQLGVSGLWAGMIGGTAVQTIILAFFTIRCDWEDEALKAYARVKKWDNSK